MAIFKKVPYDSMVSKHFDINPEGVILDIILPHGVYYIEFDKNHKCTELTKWL